MFNQRMKIGLVAASMLTCILAPASQGQQTQSDEVLRVMAWNVLHGANDVQQGAEKTLAIIQEHQPDIIMMQESYDIDGPRPELGKWLSQQLGWSYWQSESPHLCILSPMKIDQEFFHHKWHGLGAKLTDAKGRSCLAWSIWLDYRSYITGNLRDTPGISDEELLAAEDVRSNRLQQVKALLQAIKDQGQLEADIPLLVGGDFNTPSHLDWTIDTSRVYKNRRALPLPVSIQMHEAGFSDAYRTVHPNPVQRPGITWSPMYRTSGGKDQGFERIDRVYLKNPGGDANRWRLDPIRAFVLPQEWEDETIPILKRDFPSDHGAVVVDFRWTRSDQDQ
ncbi:MAG: hypothetical protein CMJ32_04330 [Phycisphaerae bacterium]|nr:hypothetical protein [Phycisphaerae bacterium]